MAYVRWGSVATHGYDSDLYIYRSSRGGYECCGCLVAREDGRGGEIVQFYDLELLIAHVGVHADRGHTVPDWLVNTLRGASLASSHTMIDPVIEQLVSEARRNNGKIASWDLDVPDDLRMKVEDWGYVPPPTRPEAGLTS